MEALRSTHGTAAPTDARKVVKLSVDDLRRNVIAVQCKPEFHRIFQDVGRNPGHPSFAWRARANYRT